SSWGHTLRPLRLRQRRYVLSRKLSAICYGSSLSTLSCPGPISPSAISPASCTWLRIECARCARRGQYSVAKLIAQHGHRGNMSKWVSDLRGDCPKRNVAQMHERCNLICPDLPKVL